MLIYDGGCLIRLSTTTMFEAGKDDNNKDKDYESGACQSEEDVAI